MWLLEQSVKLKLEKAIEANANISAEQIEIFNDNLNSDMSVNNGTAVIDVKGVLTKEPDIMAMLFGGGNTTYSSIIESINHASNDDSVKSIVLNVDSPGGQVQGMFDTIDAINAIEKPVTAFVDGMAASAAYGIASQAGKVIAKSKASMFGSVGVVVDMFVSDDVVSITSTDAPKKRPDVKTEEGIEAVRERLDAIHGLFAESIASGRNTTTSNVNKNFGRGATLLAGEALKRGMIDEIQTSSTKNKQPKAINTKEIKSMNIEELKVSHNDVYKAAMHDGIDQERDRVCAHLTMGESSGDMKTAIKAINDGEAMTQTLQAQYMSAAMNKRDLDNLMADEQELSDLNPASSVNDQDPIAMQVVKHVEQNLQFGA